MIRNIRQLWLNDQKVVITDQNEKWGQEILYQIISHYTDGHMTKAQKVNHFKVTLAKS